MQPVLALLLALAPLPTTPKESPNFLSVYSGGSTELFTDARDQGLINLFSNLEGVLAAIGEHENEPPPLSLRLAARWFVRPLSMRMGLSAENVPTVQIDVRFDDQAAALRELAALRDALEEDGIEISTSSEKPGRLEAETPEGPIVAHARQDGETGVVSIAFGRGLSAPFSMPKASLPRGMQPAFTLAFDGRALSPLLAEIGKEEGEEAAMFIDIMDELGLAGENAAPMTFALGHGEVESMTTRHVEGWKQTLFGRAASVLSRDDIELLPADTLWGWVGTFRPNILVELARSVAPEETIQGLAAAKMATGVDVEKDILGAIGPVVGAFASTATGGAAGPGGLVFFARSSNASAFLSTLNGLVSRLGQQMGMPLSPQRYAHGSIPCTAFTIPGSMLPFEPCVATANGVVFLAASRGALAEALDQAGRDTSIAQHPRMIALADGSLENLVAFGFNDAPKHLERGFGVVGMLQTSLASLAQGFGGPQELPDLTKLLPSYATLARGARPSVSLSYTRGDDLLQAVTHDSSWLARAVAMAGSPSGQMQPMTMGIASSIAIPKLLSARLAANENAAIATLRSIGSAQAQFHHSLAVDTDFDGDGEYGFLGELAGAQRLRGQEHVLDPAMLSPTFGAIEADGCGGGAVQRSGYWFQVWLPGESDAVCDTMSSPVMADAAESRWCAYAWPVDSGTSGNRAFYIDERGQLFACTNDERQPYSGTCATGGVAPGFDAALERRGDISARPPGGGTRSADGNRWTVNY